jgi:hypothetical protein
VIPQLPHVSSSSVMYLLYVVVIAFPSGGIAEWLTASLPVVAVLIKQPGLVALSVELTSKSATSEVRTDAADDLGDEHRDA